ncbi:ABC-type branched-subunit amino acid transport system substrate-binding protein [Variovorax sp. 54]|uniref:ABC transporter substrate-binding protein n=1 Tax=Variovorax sp. 54 TaxID=2035212 RepID=UPI000C1775DC|nr:ABC transporter substrate-binding protein [Variovorax sp. 54]PIF73792.1 ABC-type branched-subunit amino acid transport system substrate-binding protein [Variovorax sp. 54]
MKTTLRILASLAAFAALSVGAQNNKSKYDEGASETEIRIGHTSPQSGPASAWGGTGKAMAAYFKMVNDNGGINGRKINLITYDDSYEPARTVEATRKAIESDKVLFMAGGMGSSTQLAVAPYLNQKKVPQLFLAAAASKLTDPKKFPYTLILATTYEFEGGSWARHLSQTKPNARVAVIYQDDEAGRAVLSGFKSKLAGTNIAVVSEQTYTVADPTIDSQIIAMKNSGADAVLMVTISKMSALALRKIRALSWDPVIYVSAGGSSPKASFAPVGLESARGVIMATWRPNVSAKEFEGLPEVKAYRQFLAKYLPSVDITDDIYTAGYNTGAATAEVIRLAGNDLTRENIHKIASNLKAVRLPLMLPGISLNTTPADLRPLKQAQFFRFNGIEYEALGPIHSLE